METTSELINGGFIYVMAPYTVGQIFYNKNLALQRLIWDVENCPYQS